MVNEADFEALFNRFYANYTLDKLEVWYNELIRTNENPQRALAIGVYLEAIKKNKLLTMQDLKMCFSYVGLANYLMIALMHKNQSITRCIEQGIDYKKVDWSDYAELLKKYCPYIKSFAKTDFSFTFKCSDGVIKAYITKDGVLLVDKPKAGT